MDKTFEEVAKNLMEHKFVFAKTMAEFPHEYTLRKDWENQEDFDNVVMYIRKYGYKEKFKKMTYIYLNINGYKYWTMGSPINETILINRARNIQILPYDQIAGKYDELFQDKESVEQDKKLFKLLDYKGGSLLDVGAGTGFILDNIEVEDYLGVEPSFEMLKIFKSKHKEKIFNCNVKDLYVDRKFDYIVGTYGVGSYLTKYEIDKLEKLLNPGGKLFIMFYKNKYYPVTYRKTGIKIDRSNQEFGEDYLEFDNFMILERKG